MLTHNTIANCCFEYQYDEIQRKECLQGIFIDIFSNIYTFNLTEYFEYNNKKIPGKLQPIRYLPVYYNLNFDLVSQPSFAYL